MICNETNPETSRYGAGLLLCTLSADHPGDHEAKGADLIMSWPREPGITPTPAVGQTWRSKYGSETIASIDGNKVRWEAGGWDYLADLGPGASYQFVRGPLASAPKPNPYAMPAAWDRVSIGGTVSIDAATGVLTRAPVYGYGSPRPAGRTRPLVVHRDETKPDPRAAREQLRREIDAVLREDARRSPAFATARRAAVMAACEATIEGNLYPATVKSMVSWLHEYEDKRGAGRVPSKAAAFHARVTFGTDAQAVYERNRSTP